MVWAFMPTHHPAAQSIAGGDFLDEVPWGHIGLGTNTIHHPVVHTLPEALVHIVAWGCISFRPRQSLRHNILERISHWVPWDQICRLEQRALEFDLGSGDCC